MRSGAGGGGGRGGPRGGPRMGGGGYHNGSDDRGPKYPRRDEFGRPERDYRDAASRSAGYGMGAPRAANGMGSSGYASNNGLVPYATNDRGYGGSYSSTHAGYGAGAYASQPNVGSIDRSRVPPSGSIGLAAAAMPTVAYSHPGVALNGAYMAAAYQYAAAPPVSRPTGYPPRGTMPPMANGGM